MIIEDQTDFTCPLCGYKYDSSQKKCVTCPMGKNCKVLCCPHCGYQVIDDTYIKEIIRKVRSFFVWVKQKIFTMKY